MRRIGCIVVTVFVVLAIFLGLTACDNKDLNEDKSTVFNGQDLDLKAVFSYAVDAGYTGTYEDFVEALKGDSAYDIAVAHGFSGSEVEWLASLAGAAGRDGVSPTIGTNGNWWIADVDTGVAATGRDGNGIKYIEQVASDVQGKTKIQITFDNDTTTAFYVANGADGANGTDGAKGDRGENGDTGLTGATGNGIEKIEKTSTSGLVDTYTITFTDHTTTTFTIVNGANGSNGSNGEKGDDGNGIASIAKTGADGLVDTYTINFTNGGHATFMVTNGADGANGAKGDMGAAGKDGICITGASLNDDGELVIVLSEGDPINVGSVVGAKGDKGERGEKGEKGDSGEKGETGEKGDQGTSITNARIENNELILTIGSQDVNLGNVKGEKGDTGAAGQNGTNGEAGNGIVSIAKTGSDGLVDTYTITFTNGEHTTFEVTNGAAGAKGEKGDTGEKGEQGDVGATGNGIQSISKTSTSGLEDTYTITYTNGSTATFVVTNGAQGIQGIQGEQGIQGVKGDTGEAGHTPIITIQHGNWFIDDEDTLQAAQGVQGDTGNGISAITKTGTAGLVDTYTITFTNGNTTTFTVTNGAQGETGLQGPKGDTGAQGEQGEQGVSVSAVLIGEDGHLYVTLSNSNVPIDCGEVKDVHSHSYGEWIVLKEPTCTEKGLRSHVCSVCGAITGEEMAALGHDFVDGLCSRCHAEQEFSVSFMAEGNLVAVLHFTVSTSPTSEQIPAVPNKTGYSGVWGAYNFTNLQDQTVNAIYTANSYVVTLNPNGGNCSNASVEATYDSALELPTPIRDGYDFGGWYKDSTLFESGDVYTYAEAIELTASWSAKTFTITLDANGGECANASVLATYNEAITLPTPTKEGYTFLGWYKESELYQTGDIFSELAGITLVASWQEAGTHITSVADLQAMTSTGTYILDNDINMTSAGTWTPLATFEGVLNGNGHKIANISLENGGFIEVNNGTIRNLIMESATARGGSEYLGVVANVNNGLIENCTVTSNCSVYSTTATCLGGIVGCNTGTIRNSSSSATVQCANTTESIVIIGGFVGKTIGTIGEDAVIENCYAIGNVTLRTTVSTDGDFERTAYLGGFVGRAEMSSISNCYSSGVISCTNKVTSSDGSTAATSNVGGFVAEASNCTIENCFSACGDLTNVINAQTQTKRAGGFAAVLGDTTVTNCYRNSDFVCDGGTTQGLETTLDTMKTQSFVYSTLEWSNAVWSATGSSLPTLN